eukprot:GHVQ01035051.1.p2 GENE.GHVQ01035051.1~~GHVQ01035051.1.p2  ORF type:complete len:547 (+),score=74.28 GHVQ01035051.1:262-1902(+)
MAVSTLSGPGAVKSNQFRKGGDSHSVFKRNERTRDVRHHNIVSAKAVADTIRTSLGPRGMDKMIEDSRGGVLITNDGATILNQLAALQPTARMLVELSKAQDVEAGDGTTSVVIIAGALLDACEQLLDRGIHPQAIAHSFSEILEKVNEVLEEMATPVDLTDRDCLIKASSTALNSKVVCQNAPLLAPMAVDAVLKVIDVNTAVNVDLNDIRVVKKIGGTVDDTELVNGLVFTNQKVARRAGGPTRIANAKIGLIQFCLSTPKTDMENNITVKDYQAMDRLLREERVILSKMVKHIAATGCNVLLIQKSILRDAVTDLSLDYLAKCKIMVIRDIERDDVEFISNTIGCDPVASLEEFTSERLGFAECVSDEDAGGGGRIVRVTGTKASAKSVTVLVRASNGLMLDEAERSLHDALCVVRSLVKRRALLPGGGAPEIELSHRLHQWARTLVGVQQRCVKAYADALEVIPYTLAENSGLSPIQIVTELRNRHSQKGEKNAGINVRKGTISNILEENVVQPLLVTSSAIKLATETVMMILKIDDTVMCR